LRARGLTLVEVLVTVALSAILIALVVAIAGQVQSAVGLSSARLVAVEQVRGLFDDLTQDIARIIPAPDGAPNPPFAPQSGQSYPYPAVGLRRISFTSSLPYEPAAPWPLPEGRCADTFQVFSTMSDTSKTPSVIARAVIRYNMDPAASTAPGAPQLVTPAGGGPAVGRLRRHQVLLADPGAATATAEPFAPPVLVDNVLSFQIEYLDGRGLDTLSSAGRSVDIFKTPDTADTDNGGVNTVNGNAFTLRDPSTGNDATVLLDSGLLGPRLTAVDDRVSALLPFIPIGAPVFVQVSAPPDPPQSFLVRGPRPLIQGDNGKNCVFLNDRPINQNTSATTPIAVKAFLPPAAVRFTIVVLFGKGPENESARFVRVIPLPR
jgi:prepilin-type N-terminal cleavage/methylation domain-containing protein